MFFGNDSRALEIILAKIPGQGVILPSIPVYVRTSFVGYYRIRTRSVGDYLKALEKTSDNAGAILARAADGISIHSIR